MLTLILMASSSLMTFSKPRWSWTSVCYIFSLTSFFSFSLYNNNKYTWNKISLKLGVDKMSIPLIILSVWLVPLCLMAKKKMKMKQKNNQYSFIFLVLLISISLMITFSSLNLISFFIFFEATLIPTLMLMTNWGAKMERLQAGLYFMFYTLVGSLPLLVSIMLMKQNNFSLILPLGGGGVESLFSTKMWWILTIIAFLIKMPIYGFHLWLPKAHVEAPVAGSMILAAMLLKLGGYGLMRLTLFFSNTFYTSKIILVFCCLGAFLTSIICLRQTDLKSLMAYSSVGHMSIVAAGILLKTWWSVSGALMLMMAHGLVSSCLFALAKTYYERTSTRNISISRGFKILTLVFPIWWLISCAANLGLPPLPKLMGEILILSSLMKWSIFLAPLLGVTTVISAIYSLMIYQSANTNEKVNSKINFKLMKPREHFLMFLHLAPLLFMIFSPISCLSWFN